LALSHTVRDALTANVLGVLHARLDNVAIAPRPTFGHSPPGMRRYLPWAFWAALLLTFVMAALPHPPRLPGNPLDKVQHMAAFAVLTALAHAAWPAISRLRLLIILSTFGALIEVVQAIPALHRDSDWRDWVADTVAILVTLAFAAVVRDFVRKRQAEVATLRNGTSRRQ
jgi:hypothetical protein